MASVVHDGATNAAAMAIVCALSGCHDGSREPAAPPPFPAAAASVPAAPDAPPAGSQRHGEPSLASRMEAHYGHARRVRLAIVGGNPGDWVSSARAIADYEWPSDVPRGWSENVAPVQQVASAIAESTSLQAAASGLGELGAACASCHQKLGGPRFVVGEPEIHEAERSVRMRLHQWGADKMWEGLVGPNEEAWNAGARVLGEAALHPDEVADPAAVPAGIMKVATQLRDLAGDAPAVPRRDRPRLVAEITLTCSDCHRRLGVAPDDELTFE